MELSFCELRSKQVVNLFDGKNLGSVIDLTFDVNTTKVTGIIVPCDKSFFNIFKSNNDIFIPFHKICKIGKDIILVELTPINSLDNKQNKNHANSLYLNEENNKNNTIYNKYQNKKKNEEIYDNYNKYDNY